MLFNKEVPPMGPAKATRRGTDLVTRISQLLGQPARSRRRHPGRRVAPQRDGCPL